MSAYSHRDEEPKWQQMWRKWGIYRFDATSSSEIFSIDTPPRYTSGVLHLGHATSYPAMDFVARYRRMRGYNVFFPLCFDGNGMPVETATEKKHGITRFSVDRKTYLRLCEEYARENIERMTRQFEMLGMSLDDSIYYETHSEDFRRITQISFLRLLSRGLAYRGTFPVNWCPSCRTSLADAEVEYHEFDTKLHYISFHLKGGGSIAIATTRPELIPACQAVLVHPSDERHRGMGGKVAVLPVYGKEVPVMEDDRVDPSFGTGAVMVCSYGDREDAAWILKHKLPVVTVIDDAGRMNENAGFLSGLAAAEARERMVERIMDEHQYIRGEAIRHSVGVCWRCSTPVEILEKKQWFIRSVQSSDTVLSSADKIQWHPEFMKQRLRDWTTSLTWDWVVSRQRVFATPIPVWECPVCDYFEAASEEECYIDPVLSPPRGKCPNDGSSLRGSTDVFDTWMDSSITALYNCYWLRDEHMFKRMFPMSLRGQAHEIIRTWAYYTILRSALLVDEIPWKEIMITGFIMAPDKRPMHTHLGNVIDPVPVIEKYGADALRYYAATCTLGEDQAFRERDVVHGQRLCNKLWNIAGFAGNAGKGREAELQSPVDMWIARRYNETLEQVSRAMEDYSFSEAIRAAEQFAWHDLADNYIEMVKSRIKDGDPTACWLLRELAYGMLRMFAPFLPHVTEACYQHHLKGDAISIHVTPWPEPLGVTTALAKTGDDAVSVVTALREWRASHDFRGEIRNVTVFTADRALERCATEIKSAARVGGIRFEMPVALKRVAKEIRPNYSYLGPRYRERAAEIATALRALDLNSVTLGDDGSLTIMHGGKKVMLEREAFEIQYSFEHSGSRGEALRCGEMMLLIS